VERGCDREGFMVKREEVKLERVKGRKTWGFSNFCEEREES